MRELSPFEIGWLAGLLEGEGSFFMQRQAGRRPRFAIALSMTDEDVVARACELLEIGSYNESWNGWRPNNSTIFNARLAGPRAEDMAIKLYPHMGERRKEKIHELLVSLENELGTSGRIDKLTAVIADVTEAVRQPRMARR